MRDTDAARVGMFIRYELHPFRPVSVLCDGGAAFETYLVAASVTVFAGTTQTHVALVSPTPLRLVLDWDEFVYYEEIAIEYEAVRAARSRLGPRPVKAFAFPLPWYGA